MTTELRDKPLSSLNIAEMMELGSTSHSRARAVAEHIDKTVHQLLRIFDLHSVDVFRLLHATGSVISGSAALLLLFPWSFEPGDLDIYVPRSQINFTIKVIRDMFGFELYRTAGPYVKNEAIQGIFWFRKGEITLNVISSTTDNPLEPIFHFHSTVVMNFISSVGIFCAYPTLTLKRRGLVNAEIYERGQSISAINACLDKYRQRGFSLSHTLGEWNDMDRHTCTRDPSCPHTIRTVYDHGGLFYPFTRRSWIRTKTNLRIHGTTHSSVWSLGANRCGNTRPRMQVSSSAYILETVRPYCLVLNIHLTDKRAGRGPGGYLT